MRPLLFALVMLLSAGPLFAEPRTFLLDSKNGRRQVTFESKVPAEYIAGEATDVSGTVSTDLSLPSPDLAGTVFVPVRSMRTGIDQRDEHLWSPEWLNADAFPTIRFEVTPGTSRLTQRGRGVWAGTVSGSFSMKGVSQRLSVPITVRRLNDNELLVEGRFPVSLSAHGVRGPVAMRIIGLKVAETVQVAFRLVGKRDPGWNGKNSAKRRRPR